MNHALLVCSPRFHLHHLLACCSKQITVHSWLLCPGTDQPLSKLQAWWTGVTYTLWRRVTLNHLTLYSVKPNQALKLLTAPLNHVVSYMVISPMILYKYWVKFDSVFLPVPYRIKYRICLLDILWISYPVFMLNCKLQKWFCLKMILYGCYHNKESVVHKTQIRLSKVWCEKRNKNSGFCSTVKELEMLSTGCKFCNR